MKTPKEIELEHELRILKRAQLDLFRANEIRREADEALSKLNAAKSDLLYFANKCLEISDYWRGIAECECDCPLPKGACLKCDMDGIFFLSRKVNQEYMES